MFVRFLFNHGWVFWFLVLAGDPATAAAPRPVTVQAHLAAASPDSAVVVWRFELQEGWHLYGPFRNDSGFPPEISLDLPAGWSAGPLRWPVPRRYLSAGIILDHIYEHELLLSQTLRWPPGADPTTVTARLRWLACQEACVPGDTTLTISLPAPAAPEAAALLGETVRHLPGTLPSGLVNVRREGSTITLDVPGAEGLTFIPDPDGPFLVDLLADGHVDDSRLVLRVRPDQGPQTALSGLLIVHHNNGAQTTGPIVIP